MYGMVLNYYAGDFNRAGSHFNSIANPDNLTVPTWLAPTLGGGDLFNGNITSWMQQVWGNYTGTLPYFEQEVAASYRYDQLNRIIKNRFWTNTTGGWTRPITDPVPYDEDFAYETKMAT
jgi:hypothetical protein